MGLCDLLQSRHLSLDRIMEALRGAFLQNGLFIAFQVRVPEVFFSTSGDATSDDHCFHELDVVEITLDGPNDRHSRSIREFISEVRREATRGWETFGVCVGHVSQLRRLRF
jgi:hypothetical protein